MFGPHDDADVLGLHDALEAIAELGANTKEAIWKQRNCERINIQVRVTVQAANCSQRGSSRVEALTVDVSNGGTLVLLPKALLAGDFYWLSFQSDDLPLGDVLARCLRTSMVDERTFDAGFRFPIEVDLAAALDHRVASKS